HSEATQAGSACGDGHGQVECQEGFAALGLAADDANRFVCPQVGHQPVLLLGAIREVVGRLHRKRGHRRRLLRDLASAGVAASQTSKNSFSSICGASLWAAAASSSSAMIMRARKLPWA